MGTDSTHDATGLEALAPAGNSVPTSGWLEGLTPAQKEAVLATEGPVLVLAAAGSGKTRVITRRIAHLLSLGIPPWSILALTFTNKAAGEMRERVHTLLGGGESRQARGLTLTTFHSLCARLLRRYAQHAGLKPEFTIYDSSDQLAVCKKAIESCGLSAGNFPPRSVLSAISNAKNDLLDADAFAARAHDFSTRHVAKVYAAYSRGLRAAGAVDFDDLLMLTARLLERDAGVRDELRARWRYLLIDEYQDTNKAQFTIASLLAGEAARNPNIFVVGDPDQAIYGWRGADISNILDFEEHYPSARVVRLGENFRSTAPILASADALIKQNKRRKHKPLFTNRAGGEPVEGVLCRDERHEGELVVDWMKRLHEEGEGRLAWRDLAVFYRTNALSRVVEDAFRAHAIPYTIARGTAFYEREEIKSALGYLRVVANPADDVSLERIVNVPTRGVGDAALARVQALAGERGLAMVPALRLAREAGGVSSRALAGIDKFLAHLDAWTGGGTFLGSQVPAGLADLVDRVVRESGLYAMYKAQAATSQSDADEARLDNLDELVSSAREFEREYDPAGDPAFGDPGDPTGTPSLLALLRAYLESVALVADADAIDPAQGSVTLMTLHAAKGLEFHAVAIVGLEEGTLPHARAFDSEPALEEERRLCFVGITRAMRRLLLTCAKYRLIRGVPERTIPSRFLAELPGDHVRLSDQSDSLADLADTGWGDPRASVPAGGKSPGTAAGPTPPRRHGAFPVGSYVSHPQFGVGRVLSVSAGVSARATIEFRDVGTKTLVLEYARLTPVGTPR